MEIGEILAIRFIDAALLLWLSHAAPDPPPTHPPLTPLVGCYLLEGDRRRGGQKERGRGGEGERGRGGEEERGRGGWQETLRWMATQKDTAGRMKEVQT